MYLSVIVFVYFFNNSQRIEGVFGLICFILELTKGHYDLSQVICICIFLKATKRLIGLVLENDCLFYFFGFVIDPGHFKISVAELLSLETWILRVL